MVLDMRETRVWFQFGVEEFKDHNADFIDIDGAYWTYVGSKGPTGKKYERSVEYRKETVTLGKNTLNLDSAHSMISTKK